MQPQSFQSVQPNPLMVRTLKLSRLIRQRAQGCAPTFLALVLAPSLWAAVPKVLLSTTSLLPGETLRVEVDGLETPTKLKVQFLKRVYPFFVVGPNAQRALLGVPLDAKPGSYPLLFKTPATAPAIEWSQEPFRVEVTTRNFTIENVNFSPSKTVLMTAEHHESALIHRANLYLSRDQQWEGVFMYPVDGKRIGEFGLKRVRNGSMDAGFHKGIDLRAAKGTPALAANAGTVVLASRFKAHGNTILINHGQGVMTIYLHLQSVKVNVRQKVRKGQVIGTVGSTGLSTAPHIHYQVFVHGVPVDPQQWTESEF